MHSRIFELSKEPFLEQEERLDASYYDEHWFTSSIADWVCEAGDQQGDIEWFVGFVAKYGAHYNANNHSITFAKGFKESYFAERFERLKEITQDLTLEAFSSNIRRVCYDMEALIEINTGFQVCLTTSEGSYSYDHKTLDGFIRMLPDEESTYYFGNVLDYHY